MARHQLSCQKQLQKRQSSRKCCFCDAPGPGSVFFKDVYETADHVMTSVCWERINRLRANEPEKLAHLLAPTRANYEHIRDNGPGCKKAFSKDRAEEYGRRKYEDDDSIHQSFVRRCEGAAGNTPSDPGNQPIIRGPTADAQTAEESTSAIVEATTDGTEQTAEESTSAIVEATTDGTEQTAEESTSAIVEATTDGTEQTTGTAPHHIQASRSKSNLAKVTKHSADSSTSAKKTSKSNLAKVTKHSADSPTSAKKTSKSNLAKVTKHSADSPTSAKKTSKSNLAKVTKHSADSSAKKTRLELPPRRRGLTPTHLLSLTSSPGGRYFSTSWQM